MGAKRFLEVFREVEAVFGLRDLARDVEAFQVASHLAALCSDGELGGWEEVCEWVIPRLAAQRERLWDWVATLRGEVFHNTSSSAAKLLAIMAAQALVKLLDGEGDEEVKALAHALKAHRWLQFRGEL
ncbi:hypothetical protein MN1_700 [Thermus phage MN1]|nr:hypothetical protein MN1_700 [Thermus phage MN1]